MPEANTLQQWEYTDRSVDHHMEINYRSILSKMQEMGIEGWECVGIYEGIIYFKRLKTTNE